MKSVSARVANQQFSKLLAEVKAGKEVVITSRGEPVARIVPYRARSAEAKRQKAWDQVIKLMEEGIDLGGPPYPSRNEIYER